jgi:hypothetical protein
MTRRKPFSFAHFFWGLAKEMGRGPGQRPGYIHYIASIIYLNTLYVEITLNKCDKRIILSSESISNLLKGGLL